MTVTVPFNNEFCEYEVARAVSGCRGCMFEDSATCPADAKIDFVKEVAAGRHVESTRFPCFIEGEHIIFLRRVR